MLTLWLHFLLDSRVIWMLLLLDLIMLFILVCKPVAANGCWRKTEYSGANDTLHMKPVSDLRKSLSLHIALGKSQSTLGRTATRHQLERDHHAKYHMIPRSIYQIGGNPSMPM